MQQKCWYLKYFKGWGHNIFLCFLGLVMALGTRIMFSCSAENYSLSVPSRLPWKVYPIYWRAGVLFVSYFVKDFLSQDLRLAVLVKQGCTMLWTLYAVSAYFCIPGTMASRKQSAASILCCPSADGVLAYVIDCFSKRLTKNTLSKYSEECSMFFFFFSHSLDYFHN